MMMRKTELPKQTLFYERSGNTRHKDSNPRRDEILGEAAVPDRVRIRIEQEYFDQLKTIQRTESMPAWILTKYGSAMTQDTLTAMRRC